MDVHYGKPRNVFLTLDPFEMLEYKIRDLGREEGNWREESQIATELLIWKRQNKHIL